MTNTKNNTTLTDYIKATVNALDEKKAEDIRILDIHEVSVMADFFIIANGSNINSSIAVVIAIIINSVLIFSTHACIPSNKIQIVQRILCLINTFIIVKINTVTRQIPKDTFSPMLPFTNAIIIYIVT